MDNSFFTFRTSPAVFPAEAFFCSSEHILVLRIVRLYQNPPHRATKNAHSVFVAILDGYFPSAVL